MKPVNDEKPINLSHAMIRNIAVERYGTCPLCKGARGWYRQADRDSTAMYSTFEACGTCNGTGMVCIEREFRPTPWKPVEDVAV